MAVLTIDAGTTGVTALVVSTEGTVLARGYQEFAQHYPAAGWVEHVPEEIWQATLAATQEAVDATDAEPECVGITNQRETAVLWNRERGSAPRRAIVWQDRRTAQLCTELAEAGHEPRVTELTGLRLDPYFTATKLTWISRNDRRAWQGVMDGSVAVGTVDSYLIARMTGRRRHVTDASNASRTLLYDIHQGTWSPELCALFGVPEHALPEVVPSYGTIAETDPGEFLGLRLPISGIAGDQQAAMFGQNCYEPGSSKCTYGTGSFVLVNTGKAPVPPERGLLSTVLWQHPDGHRDFALEGSIFVTGAAVQWLRDGLGMIDSAQEAEGLARTVSDSNGVVFVPALTGLGAPHWDPQARGAILGITRGTGRAHIMRATLEAIAFEVRDVVDAMSSASGTDTEELRVDGGAAANNLLCQMQADQLGVSVARPTVQETTALGAAFLAGLGSGVWSSTEELTATWHLDRRFTPQVPDDSQRAAQEAAYRQWLRAVERAKDWVQQQ
ncbi:glycerol kinase GlpK [Lipingzhangella sp. LS1_29]|uniref:ATP:glycerol 3-phosphotransferase n=1 Tax=Lipingzhangella rawalii TaxID=2055835 RepID=A0ABU2H075_9ACTN|nr:glycerol kinase GlpK [Lipingzhangella rawalii]MDS1268706.1 glycerol kinase GlpK [Lipingzhangella rawalii]